MPPVTLMAFVVGPMEPATNRGFAGEENWSAAWRASSAAMRLSSRARAPRPYSANTTGVLPKEFVSMMSEPAWRYFRWIESTTCGLLTRRDSLQPSRCGPPKSAAVRFACCSMVPIAPFRIALRYELTTLCGSQSSFTHVAGEKFYGDRLGNHTRCGAAGEQFADGAASLFAIIQRPAIHVHSHEFVGQDRIHVTRKLQSIIQRGFAMFHSKGNAFANDTADLAPEIGAQLAPNSVCAKRQGQSRNLLPPLAEVNDAVESDLGEKQLAFVNQEAGFDFLGLYGRENFIERHGHRFDVGLEELQGEIRSCKLSRNCNFASG